MLIAYARLRQWTIKVGYSKKKEADIVKMNISNVTLKYEAGREGSCGFTGVRF